MQNGQPHKKPISHCILRVGFLANKRYKIEEINGPMIGNDKEEIAEDEFGYNARRIREIVGTNDYDVLSVNIIKSLGRTIW